MAETDSIDAWLPALREQLEPALTAIIPALHDDLKRLAGSQRRRAGATPTLSTTVLVNELYLKFAQSNGLAVGDRHHFFALAAVAIRQILTDHARRRIAATQVPLDEDNLVAPDDAERVIDIDRALVALKAINPRLVDVVNCRFFGGYDEIETATILGITDRTVRRDWNKARAWLATALDAP